MGNRKRQRYRSYLVFDQQKIRYYGAFDATYPLSDAELRFKIRFIGSGTFRPVFIEKYPLLSFSYQCFYVILYKILYTLIFKSLESSNKGRTLMIVGQKASER